MTRIPLTRRTLLLRLAQATCALALTACDGRPAAVATPQAGQGPTPSGRSPATEAVTITYWEEEPDDGDVLLDVLAAEFMAAHPPVTVTRVHFSYEELLGRVKHGNAADLVRCPSDCTAALSSSGQFAPASVLFAPAFFGRFLPGALEAATLDDEVWGVPDNYGNVLLLIYNTNQVSAPPTDTETWIARLKALTDADEDRWGLVYFLAEPYWLMPWIGGFGGWPVDAAGRPTLDTPAVVEALRFVRRLRLEEGVTPPHADYDMALDYFRQGRAAYLIDGDWSLESLRAAGIPFAVAPLPQVRASGLTPTPLATARHWFIGRASAAEPARRIAVMAFVEWMTAAPAQRRWLEKARRLPSAAEVVAVSLQDADPALAGVLAQLQQSRGLPAAPTMRCIWRAMRPGLEAVMAGSASPEAASLAMQTDARACLAAGQGK